MKNKQIIPTLFLLSLLLAACGTLEVGVEHTSTPDQSAATIAALATENAHLLTQATALAATPISTLSPVTPTPMSTPIPASPTPTPGPGSVTGRICFPGSRIPAMTAYFQNTITTRAVERTIDENQLTYGIELPPGEYIAYAWLPDFAAGGLYSEAVLCGTGWDCIDHDPRPFLVESGRVTTGIDLCDWYAHPSEVPLPQGVAAPDFSDIPYPAYVGMVTGEICYPDAETSPVRLFFQDTASDNIVDFVPETGQPSYETQLPAAEYLVYAWSPDFTLGGSYSLAVPCGLEAGADADQTCTHHAPLAFRVDAGQVTSGIDICDWAGQPGDVPLPPNAEALMPTAVPTPAPATYSSPPAGGVPDRAWLPFAGAGESMLVVYDNVVTREPAPARIELFWDYDGSSGKLAYAAQFWHSASGKDFSVSDLWVYDYSTGQGEHWLGNNVARASWSPVAGSGQLAVALFDTESERLDLALVSGPGQVETLVEGASRHFAWSPDGQSLAFVRDESSGLPSDSAGLYVIPAAGGQAARVSDLAPQYEGAPKGWWIGDRPVWALADRALIYPDEPFRIVPLDGSGDIFPTTPSGQKVDGFRMETMLWSPERRQLVGQADTMMGRSVWVYEFNQDLRTVVDSFSIGGGESADVVLIGWWEPGASVLLIDASTELGLYAGAPIVWSLAENAPLDVGN